MLRVFLLILASASAWSTQGIVLSTGQSVNFTPPGTGIWTGLTSWQYEFRVRDFSPVSSGPRVVFGGAQTNCHFTTGPILRCREEIASSSTVDLSITGRTDILVRVRRDYANLLFTVEMWDGDGSNYATGSYAISSSPATHSLSSPVGIGSYDGSQLFCTPCTIDFFRWGTTLSSIAANPPQDIAAATSLVSFEFEGNLTNSSGTVTGTLSTGSATYSTSPTYPPVLSIGGTRTIRAGEATAFTAAASFSPNGNGQFASWFWTCVGVTSTSVCEFSDRTSETPTIVMPTAGQYSVRLTGIDSSGEQSVLDTTIGAVATDSVSRVITNTSAADQTFRGPAVRQGASPWSWFDDTYLAVSAAACADIPPLPGSTLRAGTVAVTDGSAVITGTGTSFTSLGLSEGDVIVIYYATGHQRAKRITLAGMTATNLVMTDAWAAGVGAVTGASFGTTTYALSSEWTSAQTGWNYYDAVYALYQQYYRSGITEYLTCARDLADKFWAYTLDSGNICNTGTDCQPNRNQGLSGMMMRANDGVPSMWIGIANLATIDYTGWLSIQYGEPVCGNGLYCMNDPRESAYAFRFLVDIATVGPDAPTRATFLGYANAAFTGVWQRKQTSYGAYLINAAEPASGLSSLGYTGYGTFPWHYFPLLHGLQRLYALTSNADILTVHSLATGYIADQGWNPATSCYATRYATQFTLFEGGVAGAACPYSGGTVTCVQDTTCVPVGRDMGGRSLSQELVSAFGWLYATTGTASYLTRGDLMFAKTFGDSGTGSDTDGGSGTFDDYLLNAGYYLKEYAQVAGAGRAEEHLAYRLGPIPAAASTTISIGFSLAGVANATKVRATVTMPTGATSTATCTSSPCAVTGLNTNQGTAALMRLEYLSAGDAVLAAGEQQSITVN